MVLSVRHRAKRDRKPKEHKQWLIDMPLDVLIEIFLFLEPLDLLQLARAAKGFRAFLLSRRKSAALWKNAISNLKDFPPCPDHMSAPAYTHLAFVPVCHGCFCPCETIEWDLRMRCCQNCFPKMTIPRYLISRNKANRYLVDLNLPMALNHYKLNYDRGLDVTVSLVVVQCTHSFSLSDWKVVQSRKRPKKVESMKEFLAQQNDFWGSIRRHAQLCRDWEYGKLQEKAVQLSLVRKKRVKDIRDRLKELGWTEASFFYYGNKLLQLPEVNKLEPLTPVEWAEIRPQLITWLQSAKEESVCHYRMNVFGSVLVSIQQALGGDTSLKVRPSWIDVAMLPAVRSLVESNNPDMSYDDLKTKFSRVLPPAIRKWSSNAVEELEQLARKELGLLPLSKPSCLPSIIFRCKVCHHRFRFDNALSHQHLYKEKRKEPKNICEMSPYDKLLIRHDIHPRNTQVLRVDFTVSRRVENLVRRVGQNPSRVTYHELCHSTVKVVCGLCRPDVVIRMDFERAFEHCLNTHLRKKETEVWTRVSARK